MNDMAQAIIPKSDQLNADDLIVGPRTVRIRDVTIRGGQEQPVSIFFDGDGGKPYKPCKSMSRLLVAAWGADAKKYIGRSLTLFREPSVKWAGLEVGGIRISHMTDIDTPLTLALTATKGSRKPYTVRPMQAASDKDYATELADAYGKCETQEDFEALEKERGEEWPNFNKADKAALKAASDAAKARLATPEAPTP